MEKSKTEKTRSFALEGTNEHQHVAQQLKQMDGGGAKTGEAWTAELTVLKELVEHHVKEEESTGFKCARDEFDKAELERMGKQFESRKEKLIAKV